MILPIRTTRLHVIKNTVFSLNLLLNLKSMGDDVSVQILSVPDDVVLALLRDCLDTVDCSTRGWVLHGYPRTREQAELLEATGHVANRFNKYCRLFSLLLEYFAMRINL